MFDQLHSFADSRSSIYCEVVLEMVASAYKQVAQDDIPGLSLQQIDPFYS